VVTINTTKKEQPQTIIDTHTIDLSAICMAAGVTLDKRHKNNCHGFRGAVF